MKNLTTASLLLALLIALSCHKQQVDASLERLVRQSSEGGEQEATTAKQQPAAEVTKPQQGTNQSPRLYPDLPQQPQFVPPFNGVGRYNNPPISHHHGQTPFVPFGIQIPTNRLNADQQAAPFGRVLPQPRPTTPAERLQSQSFANGLGRRLLSLVGLDTGSNSTEPAADKAQQNSSIEETVRALQNSTVLQQLNKGVNSIYGSLSKMYNSTIQEQLGLLEERFKSQTQNATNPWHQRMAEQVPQFFKAMANRVEQAQSQLDKVWQDVSQAAQGNTSVLSRSMNGPGGQAPRESFFSSFDQFMNPPGPQTQGNFFNNIGRSLGFGGNNGPAPQPPQPQMMAQQSNQSQQPDLAAQLRQFWQVQVQPQIGMVRGQIARVWRDLTTSGAFSPETISYRTRLNNVQGSTMNSSSNLVDDILKEIDMSGSEYTLLEPKNDGEPQAGGASNVSAQPANDQQNTGAKLSPQMQNRLIAMQREVNQLWMGLASSLQGAINNVKRAVNPQISQFGPQNLDQMASSNRDQTATDPTLNKLDGKVSDLSKLQRDADMVYDTVQQQQREAHHLQNLGDRFKGFFNNMNVDLSGINQMPERIGQQFNRVGTVIGDLWNQIPERWDNLMQNMRPQQRQQQQNEIRAQMSPIPTPL